MKTISLVVYYFQLLAMIFSFCISFNLKDDKRIKSYMRNFYWYPFVALVTILSHLIASYFFINYVVIFVVLNNVALLFHFSFLSIFIMRAANKKITLSIKLLFILFFLMIVFFLIIHGVMKFNYSAFAIANFGLIFFSIFYYYELLTNLPTLNLKKEPSFWVVTGVFFCMATHLPVFSLLSYLSKKISYTNFNLLLAIPTLAYGIMHIFFIKAYLCSTRYLKLQ